MLYPEFRAISHRGNLNGPDPTRENNPIAIRECLSLGLEVEIDVWLHNNQFYLGHDEPKYLVKKELLNSKKVWCHAKTIKTLIYIFERNRERKLICDVFYHQNDDCVFTRKGFIWTLYGKEPTWRSIIVDLNNDLPKYDLLLGICTDYPLKCIEKYKDHNNNKKIIT